MIEDNVTVYVDYYDKPAIKGKRAGMLRGDARRV